MSFRYTLVCEGPHCADTTSPATVDTGAGTPERARQYAQQGLGWSYTPDRGDWCKHCTDWHS